MQGILDNDLYKFTMQQAVIQKFPRARVRYQFINRGGTIFPNDFARELQAEVGSWVQYQVGGSLKFWLKETCPFLNPAYIDFLSAYTFNPHEVIFTQPHGELNVTIEGPWYRTILWEVPLLALISEKYYKLTRPCINSRDEIVSRIQNKGVQIKKHGLSVADFGTRRRYSYAIHKTLVHYLADTLVGTSNVLLANHYQIKPIGTHAHEWFMFHAAKYGHVSATYLSLKHWAEAFDGELGIALTDTFTSDVFFKNFSTSFSKLFDGVRQDSGLPEAYITRVVNHYKSKKIDPSTKTIVFSDNLTIEKAIALKTLCDQAGIRCSFGIGTSLTNDVGAQPLNIVIKMSHVLLNNTWIPVVKLSDETGKHTGDNNAIQLCKEVLQCNS